MLIEEQDIKRVTHYASHKDMDPLKVFNDLNQRDFFCNADYEKMGGNKGEIDEECILNSEQSIRILSDDAQEMRELKQAILDKNIKKYSAKRQNLQFSSTLGQFRDQKKPIARDMKQVLILRSTQEDKNQFD